MSPNEFTEVVQEITGGLPVTLVVSRLVSTLKAVVDAGGVPAAAVLRDVATARSRARSRPADGAAGEEAPPARRP